MTAWPSINGAAGYAGIGGTSMAAPAAAGIAGLLFSYNPALTNTQVEQALEASAAPVNFSLAYGRVDALAALQYLGASDPQPSSAPLQTAPPQIYYELNGWTSIAPLTTAPQPGQVLIRAIGGWTGTSGLAVSGLQWQRCDASGDSCTYLTNQSTYTVQAADLGYTIKLAFSVRNAIGSTPASALSLVVGGNAPPPPPPPPSNTTPPAISGTAQDGSTLTASTGTWNGSPTSYAYQWQRCDSAGANCAPIVGATSSSYVAATADVGSTLFAVVTASNASGSASASSAPSALVASAPAPPPPPSPSPPSMQTQTFSGSLNAKNPARTFNITTGAGTATAKLSFSKCSTLNLSLAASNGAAVGNAAGPSVVTLISNLSAGGYAYTVSGGRCAFTLTVTSASP
ncbi:MAG: hypothetical protein E6G64_03065 [Actinobacteria bacterium]|nr:MAG: hypothetical protein E6G64_03065 [Actinomycetota bacterium]